MGRLIVVAAMALGMPMGMGTVVTPAIANADSCAAPCADVLTQEARWLRAITDGDVAAVESILAPDYKHITAEGRLMDRAQEIAETAPQPFVMTPTEQIVDIAGDTAVVHGLNTITQDGTVLSRQRFTDVFALQDGAWRALAAQETAI
jgi:ketosteroid isomerase-like protein